MKKNIIAGVLICIGLNSFSQIFYKSSNSQEFQDLKANGVTYIKAGNELDSTLVECLKKYWKCSKFRILDPKTEETKLNDHDVIISVHRVNNIRSQGAGTASGSVDVSFLEDILCIYSASNINSKEIISKNNIIGYVSLAGFNQGSDPASINFYLPFSISGFSSCVEKIITQQITGMYPFFNNGIADAININASKLKGKTLLIVDNTIGYVTTADLDKNGVKYVYISRGDLEKSLKDYETIEYCLLFFSRKSFTNVGIYDMSDKSLIFTWFYSSGNSLTKKFDKKDIKNIEAYNKFKK